jgi:tetratricopeptide (TPR) repeat protein
LKNIRFNDLDLFKEGEKHFIEKKYEKALESFTKFSEKYPNGKTFVAGRKAISLMELGRFGEAKKYLEGILKASVMPFPDWERHYNCLYAECLRALGEIRQSEELCYEIKKKYPEHSEDIESIVKKVSIHPHLDILRSYMDWNNRKECLLALEGIVEILSNQDGSEEEAVWYSLSLINCENNYFMKPYEFLAQYYKETGSYHNCLNLLRKLQKSMVPLAERANLTEQILAVYRLSPDFSYSIYAPAPEMVSNTIITEETIEIINWSWADLWTKFIPVLNLDKYFAREPQLMLA